MASQASIKIREREAIDRIASAVGLEPADLIAGIPNPAMRNAIVLERIAEAVVKPPAKTTRPRSKAKAKVD